MHLVPAEVHKFAGTACGGLTDVGCWRHHLRKETLILDQRKMLP